MIRTSNSRVLFVFDLAIIYLCFVIVFFYYNGAVNIPFKADLLMAFVGFFWFFIAVSSSILNLNTQSGFVEVVRNTVVAYSVLSAGTIATVAVFGDFRHNDKLILYPLLFSVTLSCVFRVFFLAAIRHLVKSGYQQKSVLLIGGGHIAEKVISQITEHPELGYTLHGVLADQYHESLPRGLYLGALSRFPDVVRARPVDEVIIALPNEDGIVSMVEKCEHEGVRVRVVPDLFRICRTRIVLDELGGVPLISVRSEPLSLLRNRMAKRLFDILFSLCLLILLSPLFLILSACIKLTSRGPVFFRQKRIGINNQEFTIVKFRSMTVQAEEASNTTWTKPNDQRVTKIGRFMRGTNLDELPQFWNVLRGDMSVVGPRPEREYFVEQFQVDIPNYKVRHLVKSGMTGLAQVNGWRGDTSIRKRVENDIYYLENWTFWLDLQIVLMTVFGKTARKNPSTIPPEQRIRLPFL